MYHGIINVYKEAGFTSHDVVAKLRGICKQKKIGHTGTLDPDAVGVLPVCLGSGTKLCDMLTGETKEYIAGFRLGIATDTQDISGKILEEKEVCVSAEQVKEMLSHFVGELQQVPPMYSALKVGGKKLYELAREGKEVERKARPITIYELELLKAEHPEYEIRVVCSKGTYIRTLCHDIGEKLGVGAAMDQLLRTKVSIFEVDQALTLAQIEERIQQEDRSFVLPVDQLFTQYPKMQVADEEAAKMLRNGNPITIGKLKSFNEAKKDQNKSRVLVYNENGEFRAIYELRGNYYRVVKMF